LAREGKTPPYFAWIFTCEETIFERISKFSLFILDFNIAMQVSSQEVSMARIMISLQLS